MAIHRDSPGSEPEPTAGADTPEPRRRFARLVESSAARRLSLARLAPALGVLLSGLIAIGFVGSWCASRMMGYIASQPDQQIPFSRIELVPEPDLWVKGGQALILGQVQQKTRRGETLRRLDLDLGELANDFRLGSPWIKRVLKVDRPPGRLRVYPEYRKPVAVVIVGESQSETVVIDEEGVPLPIDDIDWVSTKSPQRIKGVDGPLLQIWGFQPNGEPVHGIPWQFVNKTEKTSVADVMLARAAKLAGFLQERPATTPTGKPAPRIERIFMPEGPSHGFYIRDVDQNLIFWGKPPGEEEPGDLTSEARWKLLLDWVDENGPFVAKQPDCLYFSRNGVKFKKSTGPDKKKPAGS